MSREMSRTALREQQAEAVRLDEATAVCLPVRQANLKELGYGG